MDDKQLKDIILWYVSSLKGLVIRYCKGELMLVDSNTGWHEVPGLDIFSCHYSDYKHRCQQMEVKKGGSEITDYRFSTCVVVVLKLDYSKIKLSHYGFMVCVELLDKQKQMLFDTDGNLVHSSTNLFNNSLTNKYDVESHSDDDDNGDMGFGSFD